ncbi:CATRA conflict system CASPASE/TPR repeat-associated protein [Pseudofrankia asymbiotica]|uniref:CATRA conflict system CASPASE/TPR repeat-associated protein n=1 Tax=Pseudofrankia asymbiotica TaxID=1834516 RepID=UPI0010558F6D|nr:CATRA conflict system CASPASE/TPR repeat-associated protein [Pseudofrankia asymbiotica]
MHLFAPTDGPRAVAAYAYLREVWAGCREHLGMAEPVAALGLPVVMPRSVPASPDGLLAAQERPGDEVFQAVVRLEHDLVCLSAVLAPVPEPGVVDWVELRAAWNTVAGAMPSALVGAVLICQVHVSRPDGTSPPPLVSASPDLAEALALSLPPEEQRGGWAERGVTTGSGFALWEPGGGRDDRIERMLLVAAPSDRDAGLSDWTWIRADGSVAALPQYLGHAAKLRYHLRIWDGGGGLREMRRNLDESARQLREAALDSGDEQRSTGRSTSRDDLLARVRTGVVDLGAVTSRLGEMRHSVAIAAENMRAILDAERTSTIAHDPLGDDLALAEHVVRQLDADLDFLRLAVERASSVVALVDRLVEDHLPPRGQPGDPPADVPLTPTARRELRDELASLFGTGTAATELVEDAGLPRSRHRASAGTSAQEWWAEQLREMENGAVVAPYRTIIAVALRRYPYNSTLRRLARGD